MGLSYQLTPLFSDALLLSLPPSLYGLVTWFALPAAGIPEIAVPSTEPFRLSELSLSLSMGPGGYHIKLRDIDVMGISSYIVRTFR